MQKLKKMYIPNPFISHIHQSMAFLKTLIVQNFIPVIKIINGDKSRNTELNTINQIIINPVQNERGKCLLKSVIKQIYHLNSYYEISLRPYELFKPLN